MPATKFYIRNVTLYVEDLLVVLEELHVDQVMLDPRHTHLSDGEHFSNSIWRLATGNDITKITAAMTFATHVKRAAGGSESFSKVK
jgi:hypothetical protein